MKKLWRFLRFLSEYVPLFWYASRRGEFVLFFSTSEQREFHQVVRLCKEVCKKRKFLEAKEV